MINLTKFYMGRKEDGVYRWNYYITFNGCTTPKHRVFYQELVSDPACYNGLGYFWSYPNFLQYF